jgi:hypothetical protein
MEKKSGRMIFTTFHKSIEEKNIKKVRTTRGVTLAVVQPIRQIDPETGHSLICLTEASQWQVSS